MIAERHWIKLIQQQNDQSSANNLIQKYYKEIYAFLYKQVLDEQLALDLSQEVFIRMLKAIPSFNEEKASFRTWLYRIATNHCIDYFRSKESRMHRKQIFEVDEQLADPYDGTLELEYEDQYLRVQKLLMQFDSKVQQIVRYKIFGELTFNEMALLMQLPESTVKTNYYKAIQILRKEMEVYDEIEI